MMQGYNFTEDVRQVLRGAREHAVELSHEYVGTEHMLLGLAIEGEGLGRAVLEGCAIDRQAVVDAVVSMVKRGTARAGRADLPYTSRAKRVLELSMTEARELRHNYVGTEHLLLGLLREEKGIAAQILAARGLTIDRARAEVLRSLGDESVPRSDGPRVHMPWLITARRVMIVIETADGEPVARSFAAVEEAIEYLKRLPPPV